MECSLALGLMGMEWPGCAKYTTPSWAPEKQIFLLLLYLITTGSQIPCPAGPTYANQNRIRRPPVTEELHFMIFGLIY